MAALDLKETLARLADLDEVTARPTFGGHGIFWREVLFAVAHRDRLYFKVDEQSKTDFITRGMRPFRPNERQTLKSYYELPPEILDDPEALLSWAGAAIRAGIDSAGPG